MGRIVQLAPVITVSAETVRAIEILHEDAKRGRTVGLAWIALRPGILFEGDIAGAAREHIVYMRGALMTLSEDLGAAAKDDKS